MLKMTKKDQAVLANRIRKLAPHAKDELATPEQGVLDLLLFKAAFILNMSEELATAFFETEQQLRNQT